MSVSSFNRIRIHDYHTFTREKKIYVFYISFDPAKKPFLVFWGKIKVNPVEEALYKEILIKLRTILKMSI